MHDSNHRLKSVHRGLDAAGVLITIVLLGTTWYFGFSPMHRETRQLSDQQGQLKRFLKTRDSLHSARQVSESILNQQRESTAQLLARVPRDSRESDFLDLLTATASETGVTVHNFRPLGSQSGDDIGRTQIQLSGQGPYESVLQFLDRLRTAPRMNRVSRLEFGVLDQERKDCTIDLTLDLFFNAQPVDLPAGST